MDPLVNLFYAELTGLPYADTDTSMTLTAGSVADLPDADTEGAYNLVIWDRAHGSPAEAKRAGGVFEIVRVTSDDAGTDTITVSRGQEATTPQSYSSGNVYGVLLSPTKKYFDELILEFKTIYEADPLGSSFTADTTVYTIGGLTVGENYRIVWTGALNQDSVNLPQRSTVFFKIVHDTIIEDEINVSAYRESGDGSDAVPFTVVAIFTASATSATLAADWIEGDAYLRRSKVVVEKITAKESADITIT